MVKSNASIQHHYEVAKATWLKLSSEIRIPSVEELMGASTEDLVNVLDNANPLLNTLDLDLSPEQDTIQELSSTVTIGLSAHQARGMVQPHMDPSNRTVLVQTLMHLDDFTKQCIIQLDLMPVTDNTEVSDTLAHLSTVSEAMLLQCTLNARWMMDPPTKTLLLNPASSNTLPPPDTHCPTLMPASSWQ